MVSGHSLIGFPLPVLRGSPPASPYSHGGREKPLPQDAYFLDKALKGVPTSVSETAGSRQDAAGSYRVVKNMNRRTAEQGTVEYRSEKHFLILF